MKDKSTPTADFLINDQRTGSLSKLLAWVARLPKPHFVLAALCLVGCNSQLAPSPTPVSTQDVAFATVVPIAELNTHIKLEILNDATNQLKVGSDFDIWVNNVGSDPVSFHYNWGVKILTYSQVEAKWVAVSNRVEYGVRNDIALDVKGRGPNWQGLLSVRPDLPKSQQPVIVRVVVLGQLGQESKTPGQSVGAYLDVTLLP